MELVYIVDLKSAAEWHAGSTPAPGTANFRQKFLCEFLS